MFKRKLILDNKKIKAYNRFRVETNRDLPLCLAPFKSLRFMPEGNITVCCHNNSFVLGRYPDVSPIDAWNGQEIKIIRKNFQKLISLLVVNLVFMLSKNRLLILRILYFMRILKWINFILLYSTLRLQPNVT
jgi:hypothetical protein